MSALVDRGRACLVGLQLESVGDMFARHARDPVPPPATTPATATLPAAAPAANAATNDSPPPEIIKGTGELVGLSGKRNIIITEGKHSYEFDYVLAKTE